MLSQIGRFPHYIGLPKELSVYQPLKKLSAEKIRFRLLHCAISAGGGSHRPRSWSPAAAFRRLRISCSRCSFERGLLTGGFMRTVLEGARKRLARMGKGWRVHRCNLLNGNRLSFGEIERECPNTAPTRPGPCSGYDPVRDIADLNCKKLERWDVLTRIIGFRLDLKLPLECYPAILGSLLA